MRNFILIFVFLFALTGSYANNFDNQFIKTELNKTDVLIKLTPDQVMNMTVNELEGLILNISPKYENACTVTVRVSGTIEIPKVGSVTVEVEVTGSCSEARDIAIAVKDQILVLSLKSHHEKKVPVPKGAQQQS